MLLMRSRFVDMCCWVTCEIGGKFRTEGAIHISNALRENSSLLYLDIGGDCFSYLFSSWFVVLWWRWFSLFFSFFFFMDGIGLHSFLLFVNLCVLFAFMCDRQSDWCWRCSISLGCIEREFDLDAFGALQWVFFSLPLCSWCVFVEIIVPPPFFSDFGHVCLFI